MTTMYMEVRVSKILFLIAAVLFVISAAGGHLGDLHLVDWGLASLAGGFLVNS